jgi:hypothetical protein
MESSQSVPHVLSFARPRLGFWLLFFFVPALSALSAATRDSMVPYGGCIRLLSCHFAHANSSLAGTAQDRSERGLIQEEERRNPALQLDQLNSGG